MYSLLFISKRHNSLSILIFYITYIFTTIKFESLIRAWRQNVHLCFVYKGTEMFICLYMYIDNHNEGGRIRVPYVCIYARWHIAQVEIIGRTIETNIISLRTESREDYICMIILHTRLAPYNGRGIYALGERAQWFDLLLYDVISTP